MASQQEVMRDLCFFKLLRDKVIEHPSASQLVKRSAENLILFDLKRVALQAVEVIKDAIEKRQKNTEFTNFCEFLNTSLGNDMCHQILEKAKEDLSLKDEVSTAEHFEELRKDSEAIVTDRSNSGNERRGWGPMAKILSGAVILLQIFNPFTELKYEAQDNKRIMGRENLHEITTLAYKEQRDESWSVGNANAASCQHIPQSRRAPPNTTGVTASSISNWLSGMDRRREVPLSSLIGNADDLFTANDLVAAFGDRTANPSIVDTNPNRVGPSTLEIETRSTSDWPEENQQK